MRLLLRAGRHADGGHPRVLRRPNARTRESAGLSLAKLLKDALLVSEERIEAGYEPGTSLQA